jgi:glutathione S-transferase
MDLYFSPLAGSLAARIALYEAGADARFIEVDPETKRTSDGSDFAEIYPLGLVPLLRLDDGSLLSERRDSPIHCQSISLIEPRPHR